jgi:hypothetical protein
MSQVEEKEGEEGMKGRWRSEERQTNLTDGRTRKDG